MTIFKKLTSLIPNHSMGALLPILLLAPLAMAPKGCDQPIVGNDCPPNVVCSGDAGSSGGPTAGASSAGAPSAGSASGGASSGASCGGLRGAVCAKDEYCAFSADAACGAGDQPGICKKKPDACDGIYGPICGCDGKTYSNECVAASAGTSVAKGGACAPDTGKVCGGLQGLGCAKGEYCKFAPEAKCGAADQAGTCAAQDGIACLQVYAPVCGCDGKTYSNECTAATAGVSIASDGACPVHSGTACGGLNGLTCAKGEFCKFAPDAMCGAADQTGTCTAVGGIACLQDYSPVCGCDGKTYSNACQADVSGVSVASNGACGTAANDCGGITGKACPKGQFCDFPVSTQCGNADFLGTCRVPPTICDAVSSPVCGCDGKTYDSPCVAARAGVSVFATGKCQ